MPHGGEYVDRSGKKRVYFEDSDSEYDRPTVKRKVYLGILFSNSGHQKDRGSGSKGGSARKRKSEVGESLSRVGYHGREGHSTAGGEE